jgi:hypothetical protein
MTPSATVSRRAENQATGASTVARKKKGKDITREIKQREIRFFHLIYTREHDGDVVRRGCDEETRHLKFVDAKREGFLNSRRSEGEPQAADGEAWYEYWKTWHQGRRDEEEIKWEIKKKDKLQEEKEKKRQRAG